MGEKGDTFILHQGMLMKIVQLNWSALTKRGISYLASYFKGYGDGLIFYNESIQRLSVGF